MLQNLLIYYDLMGKKIYENLVNEIIAHERLEINYLKQGFSMEKSHEKSMEDAYQNLKHFIEKLPELERIIDIENSTTTKNHLLKKIKSQLTIPKSKIQMTQKQLEFIYEYYKKNHISNKILWTKDGSKQIQLYDHKTKGLGHL
ncbi:hypothetical protein M0812_08939 [Anaeramoeba flamelloides]|uniref:Uncharacterized protein n=1 Tax=Anaeramoeba flamelloides TaxID=1746091 RepID=A0AAV7ZM68_9EUKA|nr:hypothetical protein M0812_08939 [Anaeramoeba flamelloides]